MERLLGYDNNPFLNSMVDDIEFLNDNITEYSDNIIAEYTLDPS